MKIDIDKNIKEGIVLAKYLINTKEIKFESIQVFSRKESEMNINRVLRKLKLLDGTYGNNKPKKSVQSISIKLIKEI